MGKAKESREYVIKRPFPVKIEHPQKHWWKLPDNIADEFFSSNGIVAYQTKIGIYVFARKHGGRYTPIYIGKSINSFGAEIFNPSNQLTYNNLIMELNGDFSIFLIIPLDIDADDKWSGDSRNISFRRDEEIDDIETYFIQKAAKINPGLKNKYKRKTPEWHINDVIRGHRTKGRKKSPLREFRQMMGIM